MTKISVKNIKGESLKEISLDDKIWNIKVNDDVLQKMLRLQLNSLRQGTRKTKTRSEVSGGGRKPWKQKGTGRARQGSRRAPQWIGGGVAFGVIPQNFDFKINKKESRLALKTALTYKIKDKKVIIVDKIEFKDFKTKKMIDLLNALQLKGKVVFITKEDNENLYMAGRNLKNVWVIMPDEINCYYVTNAEYLVIEEEALKVIEEVLK